MLKKLLCILMFIPTMIFAADFIEGKDYQVVATVQSSGVKLTKPVVTEFFSYGCPWCFKMEASFDTWMTSVGTAVQVDRVPVMFKPEWEIYSKAYYTAKMLALSDKMTPLLFKAIQEDKKTLHSKQEMVDFFIAQGVDKEIAKSAFENSPSIDMRVNNANSLMASYQITAIPSFVVNNKYKTDLQMAGTPERLFEIVNYLVKKNS